MSTSQPDDRGDADPNVDVVGDLPPTTQSGDDLLTSAMGLADLPVVVSGGGSTSATAAAEHHFPLMPPATVDELPSDSMLYGRPVAVSGAIIRRPRSRKQGHHDPSNAGADATGTDVVGGGSAGDDDDDDDDGQTSSWQPLVTESSISSLLDTLSVAASDNEASETMLTSCDMRLQTLERADLSRCVIGHALIGIRPL